MAKLVDINIYDRAEETARADHPKATDAEVRERAEAFQQAYEDWADVMEQRDARERVRQGKDY